MNGFDAGTLALIAAIYLAGGFVKGAIGFGLPLVTISVLPFFLPVDLALALNSVVLLAVNAVQTVRAGETGAAFRLATPMLVGTALATPFGVWLATALPGPVLMLVLGCFVIAFSILGLLAISPKLSSTTRNGVLVGGVGGIVGAVSSAPGPVFVMYLVGLRLPRQRFMALMGLLMGAVGAFLAVGFLITGVLDGPRLALGVGLLVPATAGFLIGDHFARRVPEEAFRKIVLAMLVVLGVAIVRRAIGAMG